MGRVLANTSSSTRVRGVVRGELALAEVMAAESWHSYSGSPLSGIARPGVGLAPLGARAAHIVQLGTIVTPPIGQHCPPIIGELGAQFQSRRGET
jgi:hypothetical protein